ncbi:MAG: hypothetical protein CTY36_01570 [Methylocystis sp.]|nr:MAG: hypothetical protein CTY36_01570 [Methylocystis sp.]
MTEQADDGDDDGALEVGEGLLFSNGQPVLLAARVARAFGVETREVNQAVRRNPEKFNELYTFELSPEEVEFLTSQAVISKPGRGGSRAAPRVFTQKGVMRLATVIKSPKALEATDLMIDIFVDVYRQLAQGKTEIEIANPSRLVPPEAEVSQFQKIRGKLYKALDSLLDTVIDSKQCTTIRDELEEVSGGALSHLKERFKTKGLENEKIAADTLLILEKAREIRERTSADVRKSDAETEKVLLENLDKKIGLVERLSGMIDKLEPNAIATLFPSFATPGALPAAAPRKLSPPKEVGSKD